MCLTTKHPGLVCRPPCDASEPFSVCLGHMRSLMIGLTMLCGLMVACSGSPALLGSQFADAYAAFAPLYVLHRSYGEYLFSGKAVEIPEDLPDSCERFSYELALFHVDYVVQTESAAAGGLAYLVRLRAESTSFCDVYDESIRAIAEADEVDDDVLSAASDGGLFAEIKRMNDLMEAALDEILAGMGEGIERWAFAVTFSIRTLLNQTEVERISTNLREILYADPEGTESPFAVPAEIATAMERLVELSGRELSETEREDAVRSATLIYEFFVAEL
jgi:hypothetical protein